MASPDKRIQYTEYMVGAAYSSPDTLNRLTLIDHANSGAHTAITRDDLTNNDGSQRAANDLVVQDTSGASRFKRTTTQGDAHDAYVVVETIDNAATGRVAYAGFVTVNVQGNVAVGDFLRPSTTSGRAESAGATIAPGCFGRAYTAYSGGGAGTVTAYLFGVTAQTVPTSLLSTSTGLTSAAVGDLLYASATTPTWSRLAAVAAGSYLRANGTNAAPVWSTLTLPNAATTGDLLYATGANAIGVRAAVAAGQVLISQGTSTAPIWSASPTLASLTIGTAVGTPTASPDKLLISGASATPGSSTGNVQINSTDSAAIDLGGSLVLGGLYNGTSNNRSFAMIAGRKENANANDFAGYLQFSTQPNAAGMAERMRITSAGNVGIGMTPTVQFELSGSVGQKATGTTWSNPSDARLKTVLGDFTDGLDVLRRLPRFVAYELNGLAGTRNGERGISVIAQELAATGVAPYTLDTYWAKLRPEDEAPTELYRFEASALTFVALNALKEIDASMTALTARVAELEARRS